LKIFQNKKHSFFFGFPEIFSYFSVFFLSGILEEEFKPEKPDGIHKEVFQFFSWNFNRIPLTKPAIIYYYFLQYMEKLSKVKLAFFGSFFKQSINGTSGYNSHNCYI